MLNEYPPRLHRGSLENIGGPYRRGPIDINTSRLGLRCPWKYPPPAHRLPGIGQSLIARRNAHACSLGYKSSPWEQAWSSMRVWCHLLLLLPQGLPLVPFISAPPDKQQIQQCSPKNMPGLGPAELLHKRILLLSGPEDQVFPLTISSCVDAEENQQKSPATKR